MAIFGFQLCLTVIMASFLQKFTPIFSLGRWILCSGSLIKYLHPTNEELKKLAGKDTGEKQQRNNRNTTKRRHQNHKSPPEKSAPSTKPETFKVPKNANITLDREKVNRIDTLGLKKYEDYEWLFDYTVYTSVVYAITEIYFGWWKPAPEFNISMVWTLLAIGFVCKNLISIMRLYFKTDTGELSTCITFGCFSFVMAMAVLIVDEQTLEFGLDSAYSSFLQNASSLSIRFTEEVGPRPAPVSLPVIKVGVALISGLIGTLLAFPGIRTAQMYVDGLKYSKGNQLIQLLLHINFITPFLICFMWVKPLARDILCPLEDDSNSKKTLTHNQFDIARIIIILVLCVLKLVSIRIHLQAYLNIAYLKIRNMKREAGYTTNIDIQKLVARVFYYLCVVTLQYIAPILLVMLLAMNLKTLGGHSWQQVRSEYVGNHTVADLHSGPKEGITEESSFKEMVAHAGISLSHLSAVFTPLVFRGILSFLLWWLCASWFVASCLGVVYHTYLTIN